MLLALLLAAGDTACDRLAADYRRRGADRAAFARALNGPGARLARAVLAPAVRLAPAAADVSAALAGRIAASFPDAAGGEVLHLYQAGDLQQAVWLGGTLHCESEALFMRAPDGSLVAKASPPAYADLCWISYRQLGTALGRPAMVEVDERGQDQPYRGFDLAVTPWVDGAADGWGPPCGLRVRYDDRFILAERFCGGDAGLCAAGAALAPRLAEALARGLTGAALAAAVAAPPADAAFRTASDRLSDLGDDAALPTFGATPRTEFPDWSYSKRVPVAVGGAVLLARVGVGGIGWRAIGDYLVALYRLAGDRPVPVASYVVRREVTGLREAAVVRPVPYHDTR